MDWIGLVDVFLLSQEKAIDLESDLEEIQDSEQSWARKHKRAIEQVRLSAYS